MTAVLRRHALTAYAALAFMYLLLPIAVVIAFSFNDPKGRFNYVWQGFTVDNWHNWDAVPGLRAHTLEVCAHDARVEIANQLSHATPACLPARSPSRRCE